MGIGMGKLDEALKRLYIIIVVIFFIMAAMTKPAWIEVGEKERDKEWIAAMEILMTFYMSLSLIALFLTLIRYGSAAAGIAAVTLGLAAIVLGLVQTIFMFFRGGMFLLLLGLLIFAIRSIISKIRYANAS